MDTAMSPALPATLLSSHFTRSLIRVIHALLFLPTDDYWWLVTAIALSNVALLIGLTYLRALLALDFDETLVFRAITTF